MTDEKDALPSDAEKGALKPRDPKDPKAAEPSTPPPEDEAPSEQPS